MTFVDCNPDDILIGVGSWRWRKKTKKKTHFLTVPVSLTLNVVAVVVLVVVELEIGWNGIRLVVGGGVIGGQLEQPVSAAQLLEKPQ